MRTGLAVEAFEATFKQRGFKPSQGQLDTAGMIGSHLELAEADRSIMLVKGLSGSGKTALLDVLADPLRQFRTAVVDDLISPYAFLKINGEIRHVISTLQASSRPNPLSVTPFELAVFNHKGFKDKEIIDRLLAGEDVGGETPAERRTNAVGIAGISFGSFRFAQIIAQKHFAFWDDDAVVKEATDFLLGQFPAFRTAEYSDAETTLREFLPSQVNEYRLKQILVQIRRSKSKYERLTAEIDELISRPPIEGIPFAFRTINSRAIYDSVVNQVALSEPAINVIAPNLGPHLELIALTLGVDSLGEWSPGRNDPMFAARILAAAEGNSPLPPGFTWHPLSKNSLAFDKTYLRIIDPKDAGEAYKGIRETIWSRFKLDGNRVQLIDRVRRVLNVSQESVVLDFHSHAHSLESYTIKLGIAVETILQYLGIDYVVSYPPSDRGRRRYFQFRAGQDIMQRFDKSSDIFLQGDVDN